MSESFDGKVAIVTGAAGGRGRAIVLAFAGAGASVVAADISEQELAEISCTSNTAAASLGVPYRWVTSYVAGDKIYCLHEADDAETIREHARRGGFPADLVSVVANEFGPQTAQLRAS